MHVYCDRERYFQLIQQRPELFEKVEGGLTIITDEAEIEEFIQNNGRQIGIAHESEYSLMAIDLVQDKDGRRFAYERLIPVNTGAIVGIPIYEGRFVLLYQYRHAIRDFQLSFPRGFGERGLSSRENLKKELAEELGAAVRQISHLGRLSPDSGISGAFADVYSCRITKPALKQGYEGIREIRIVSAEELQRCICRGDITDGITLAAFALYNARYQAKASQQAKARGWS